MYVVWVNWDYAIAIPVVRLCVNGSPQGFIQVSVCMVKGHSACGKDSLCLQ